jgi:hypothetical protein
MSNVAPEQAVPGQSSQDASRIEESGRSRTRFRDDPEHYSRMNPNRIPG